MGIKHRFRLENTYCRKNRKGDVNIMTSNINVINNTNSNVDVKINEVNGAIQIIIDVPSVRTELSHLDPGDVFEKNGIEYIVCEQFEDGRTAVVRKECLDVTMKFGNNNNWKESVWRKYLNDTYLAEIENIFGKENIIEHEVDLTSLDGYDDYGVSVDKVSAMDIDRYRKYHKHIGNTGEWYYLSTPDSTPSGTGSSNVQYVNDVGGVYWDFAGNVRSVPPFFILNSNILVSLKNAE